VDWISDLNSLSDFVGYVVLCAPDAFPEEDFLQPDEQMNLERAFEEMRNALNLFKPAKMDAAKRRDALCLLEESLNFYHAGEVVKGAHLLQDFRSFIFKKQTVRSE
jgi:hypothetical protein